MEFPCILEWSPDVKTVGAFKPGDILAIECLHMLTATQFAQLRTNLDRQEERLVARRAEAEEAAPPPALSADL